MSLRSPGSWVAQYSRVTVSAPINVCDNMRAGALETTDSRTSTTLNNFVHSRSLAGPDDTWANGPSQDVLYSTAWLNLANGPVYLDIPEVQSRYYSLVSIDFYSNSFFYAGERTTGTQAQKHLVVGPDRQGEIPADATVVRAPTNDVNVICAFRRQGPPTKLRRMLCRMDSASPPLNLCRKARRSGFSPPTVTPRTTSMSSIRCSS